MENEARSAALRLAGWILKDALEERRSPDKPASGASPEVVDELARLAQELENLGR